MIEVEFCLICHSLPIRFQPTPLRDVDVIWFDFEEDREDEQRIVICHSCLSRIADGIPPLLERELMAATNARISCYELVRESNFHHSVVLKCLDYRILVDDRTGNDYVVEGWSIELERGVVLVERVFKSAQEGLEYWKENRRELCDSNTVMKNTHTQVR